MQAKMKSLFVLVVALRQIARLVMYPFVVNCEFLKNNVVMDTTASLSWHT